METLKQNKKYIAIPELLFAIIVSTILIPFGILFSFINPIFFYNSKRNLFVYFKDLIVQIYTVLMYLFHHLALTIDILGNVIVGDLIELFVTKKRNTLFGDRKYTISEAFGFLVNYKFLNNFGKKVVKMIDFIFGKNHCLNAFKNE